MENSRRMWVEDEDMDLIDRLIEDQLWDQVEERLREHPDEARQPPSVINPVRGWTRLHWLCSMGSTPGRIVELVASLHPEALVQADRRSGDTPLHIACRNSLVSADKVTSLLLQYCQQNPEAILIRNQMGGTALHSASNHNAVLAVLEALVQASDRMIRATTTQGVHAVTALWLSYMQTIPGHMCVAQILLGDTIHNNHFERFWSKCEFLALAYYRRSNNSACPTNLEPHELKNYVLQGLIQCNVPLNLFKVALKRNPSYALAQDANGNLPLHVMLENRPYRLKEKEALRVLIRAAPAAASQPNYQGDVPLVVAIRNRVPWENGVDDVVNTAPTVAWRRDRSTGLLPFQLAASIGGKVSIETTYHLLSMQPDLLNVTAQYGVLE